MAFDEHKKRLAEERAAAERVAAVREGSGELFEAELPRLKKALRVAMDEFARDLEEMSLDPEVHTDGPIALRSGAKVSIKDTDTFIARIMFRLPPPRDSDATFFMHKVAVLAVIPKGDPWIELHVTNIEGRARESYMLRGSITATTDDATVKRLIEQEIDQFLSTYKRK